MARRLLRRCEALENFPRPDADGEHREWRDATLLAALLHDVGHGPFSHVFEEISRTTFGIHVDHEAWTKQIVRRPAVRSPIEEHCGARTYEKLLELFDVDPGFNIYSTIISSQLDADRLDFLVRDRYFSGIQVGFLDLEWILDSMRIFTHPVDGELLDPSAEASETGKFQYSVAYSDKGKSALEEFILSYIHMYNSLYFHKTTRSAQIMLGDLLQGLAEDGRLDKCPAHNALIKYFKSRNDVELETYLETDDIAIWEIVFFVAKNDLGEPSRIATRLTNRDLYKCFEVPSQHFAISPFKEMEFCNRLREAGIEFREDRFATKSIKEYDEGTPKYFLNLLIWPEGKDFPLSIGRLNPLINEQAQRSIKRFYFPHDGDDQKAEEIWNSLGD